MLGQFDFLHNGPNVITNAGLWNPQSVAIDHSVVPNRLYVADAGNHRVLGWHSLAALINGSPADLVIGQQDFLSWFSECNNAAVTGSTLCVPAGIAVDGAGNLYVADFGNNRVLEYDTPFTTDTQPDLVFGQGGSFTTSGCNQDKAISAATLCGPSDVAVDATGNVYIADTSNSRVLEYDLPLVTDVQADRVFGQNRAFDSAACNVSGLNADSLCRPAAVTLDGAGNLYIADNGNFRALEYDKPLASGSVTAALVFGQANFSSNANSCAAPAGAGALCTPAGLGTDSAGNLYISDSSFSRIQAYNNPVASRSTAPIAVFGQAGFSTAMCNSGGLGPSSLCLPFGMALDAGGDLFAADFGNQRVLEYVKALSTHPPNTKASLVLGQLALDRNGINVAKPGSLFWPAAVAVDASVSPNRLYVADASNSRVLGWRSMASFANGAPADLVVGQPDLFSAGCNQNRTNAAGDTLAGADTLCLAGGVAVDAAGNLYVADSGNFRVLEYDAPFATGKSAGPSANLVLGQNGSFTMRASNNGGISASSMAAPAGIAIDRLGHLYVTDPVNNRVLEYDHPSSANTAADAVFGQGGNFLGSNCNFDGGCSRVGCTATADSLCGPSAAVADNAGNLYVTDTLNNRVLQFLQPLDFGRPTANVVIGQVNFKAVACATLCQPQGVALDRQGNVYVADGVSAQVKEYNAPLSVGQAPNLIIGSKQCDQAEAQADTLCNPAGLAFDAVGNLYAADTFNNRVLEYNPPFIPPTPTPTRTPTPRPTATPIPGTPFIKSIPQVILVGGPFNITGLNFTRGSEVNFFVSTATGSINAGPFIPIANSLPTQLTVIVPAKTTLGQGFVDVQVINTDKGFLRSNSAFALLQGSAAAGIPSLTSINGVGLAATSSDPSFGTNNVETVVPPGSVVSLGGMGFDTTNGVGVDLFCACPAGKVGPFLLKPGNAGLSKAVLRFSLPKTGPKAPPTGPGSFVVSNAGSQKTYSKKSNAVSVPIGQKISVTSVTQVASTIMVNGTGFSTLTVINFFNTQPGGMVNLGGLEARGAPRIPLTLVNSGRFTFTKPSAAVPGPSYLQALNPPFVPFTSSGNGPGGAFTLK